VQIGLFAQLKLTQCAPISGLAEIGFFVVLSGPGIELHSPCATTRSCAPVSAGGPLFPALYFLECKQRARCLSSATKIAVPQKFASDFRNFRPFAPPQWQRAGKVLDRGPGVRTPPPNHRQAAVHRCRSPNHAGVGQGRHRPVRGARRRSLRGSRSRSAADRSLADAPLRRARAGPRSAARGPLCCVRRASASCGRRPH